MPLSLRNLMRSVLRIVGFVAVLLLLAACRSSSRQEPVRITYPTDPDELIVFADENITPGGYSIGQECNHIPRLRIWGDGATVYSDIVDGRRRVLTGQTSPEQINAILQRLNALEYFTNPPDSTFTSSGMGYRLGIRLESGSHDSFWSQPNEIYPAVFETFDPAILSEFSPEEGYLVVGPRLRQDMFPNAPIWPDRFGFRLSDEDSSGRTLRGEPLDFLWQAINAQPAPLTGVQDGDGIYAVAVFVEGISLGHPPFRCWNK